VAAPRRTRAPSADLGSALGGWIRERRSAQGVSQRELADRATMSRSYLCDLERGRGKQPSMNVVQALARALGEDPDELLRQAGLIQRPPEREDDLQERRILAIFRSLSDPGQDAVERFARFLHSDEQRWVQPTLVDGDAADHLPLRTVQSGPTLFDAVESSSV